MFRAVLSISSQSSDSMPEITSPRDGDTESKANNKCKQSQKTTDVTDGIDKFTDKNQSQSHSKVMTQNNDREREKERKNKRKRIKKSRKSH